MRIGRKRKKTGYVAPDEIFLDSTNLPKFDTHHLEGRLERPVSRTTHFALATLFTLAAVFYVWRIGVLEISRGEAFKERSEKNTLTQIPIFSARGVIYDRNGVELAWNAPERMYKYVPGLAQTVGYVGLPSAEDVTPEMTSPDQVIGRSGLEKVMNSTLEGKHGIKIVEKDVHGAVQSENLQVAPENGESVTISIDSELEGEMFKEISNLASDRGFEGGAGAILDLRSGEVLASVSYPTFDQNDLVFKKDAKAIAAYNSDSRKPFLDRVITGQYTPGSIVKPFMALAALSEHIITPEKQILSTGSISIPNQYNQEESTVFMDWKAHGWVDMRHALSVSSDVYFYAIGGGYKDQEGLGINAIEQYMRMFGFAAPTGIELSGERIGTIPSPRWKEQNFNGESWRLGDTYHTVIGQYGFQVTLLQMARAIGAIATKGTLLTPTILHKDSSVPRRTPAKIALAEKDFTVVKEGMALSAEVGTAKGLAGLGVKIGAKTGTAELGVGKEKVNSWVVGFLPYDNPKIAFVAVLEKGPRTNLVGATFAMRNVIEWIVKNRPEYVDGVTSNYELVNSN